MNKLVVIAIGFCLGLLSSAQTNLFPTFIVSEKVIIEITDVGFVPREAVVKKNGSVVFINKRTRDAWPAANPHPIHTLYPEFDPRESIKPQGTWVFIAAQVGSWRYHDHVYPSSTGKLIIVGGRKDLQEQADCSRLIKLPLAQREYCWDELLSSAFDKRGITGAFAVFKKLYATDKEFIASGCHAHAHRIGDAFYALYAKRGNFKQLDLPYETVYCGYGFYHGLFEHLFRDTRDIEIGKDICNYLDEKLSKRIPRIRSNCYHGLGHGFTWEPTDKRIWGNPQAIIDPALSVCDTISANKIEVTECLQGVFNVISEWSSEKYYNLSFNKRDPMGLCSTQKTREHTLACYYESSMHLRSLVGEDIVSIAHKYIDTIADDEAAKTIIRSVAAGSMQRAIIKDDHNEYIQACYLLSPRLQNNCINGLAAGFVAHGEPEKEYIKALKFCASHLLNPGDAESCYISIISTFRGVYQESKFKEVCKQIPDGFRQLCERNDA